MFRCVSFPRTVFLSCGLLAVSVLPLRAATITWDITGGGEWSTGANWSSKSTPGSSDTAGFGTSIAADSTITLLNDEMVNIVAFDNNTHRYTIASAGGSLEIDDRIYVIAGDHLVSADVVLTGNAKLQVASGNSLTISGEISGSQSLEKTGSGTATLTGTLSHSGGTTVTNGTLVVTTTSLFDDVTNNATLGFDQDSNGSYSAVISGSGAVTKTGSGAVTFAGANTYSGGTTISAGSLIGTTSSLQGDITNNAALTFNQSSNGTYADIISGTGSVTKSGSGNLTLSGTHTYTGGTTISAGTLTLGHATNTLADTGSVAVTGGTLALGTNSDSVGAVSMSSGSITGSGTLTGSSYSFTDAGSVSANLAGPGSVTKSGAGTVTLSGTNTYSGGTTVSGGTLAISADANLGDTSGGLSIDNATLQIGGDFTFNHATTVANGAMIKIGSSTLDWDKRILGSGGLTISGSGGTITSFQDHDFTDGLTLEDVTFRTGSYGNLGDTGEAITLDGGTLFQTNSSNRDTSRTINLIGDGGTFDGDSGNSILSGSVTGSGSLTAAGSNVLNISGSAKTYTGATVVNEGTLRLSTVDVIATSSGVTLADATGVTLDLNNTNQTLAGLSGGGSTGGNITLGTGTLTVDTTATSTFGGAISGTGAFTKSGTGILTLSGANTYTGATTVNDGLLTVSGGGSIIGTTNAITQSGGALTVSNATVTLGSSASGVFGVGYGATGTGTATVDNGGVLNVGTGGGRTFIGGGPSGGT
ncbi:MAG: hypothetical protein HOH58_07055, partial [Opitutaceae bacterium]|nr:hypothetical protein [Opitutaceae bacterium]